MKKLLESCNNIFGTNVSEKEFRWVYDIYDSKEGFERSVNNSFDELEEVGTARIIDNKYVFFNDVNYDWKLNQPMEMPD